MDWIRILIIVAIIIQEIQIIWINNRINDIEDMFAALLDNTVKKTIRIINLEEKDEDDE